MQMAIFIKAFEFDHALMQEHFNENYMESDKYPQATFKGNVENMNQVDMTKDGTYNVKVKGNLTIHGVTKEVEAPGTLTVKGGKLTAGNSTFQVKPEDYGISIPSVVRQKIADQMKVTVDLAFLEYKKG